jgi:ribonuclease P protein component
VAATPRAQRSRSGAVPSEQAYVSAQQPASAQDARFPSAHAYASWPCGVVEAAPEGTPAPGRLSLAEASAVLPAAVRMRSSEEFTAVVRFGRRAGCSTLVVHALTTAADASGGTPRIGLIVGRAVGGAVSRNRTRRQLRHLMRSRLGSLPTSCRVVIRALRPAGGASSATLASDLDRCLARALAMR